MHAMDVFRARLHAHEDDALAVGRELLGFFGVEDDFAGRRTRRCGKARRDAFFRRVGIERGMQQLIERLRIDAGDRGFLVDQAFTHHVDGDLERGLPRCACRSGSAA